MGKLRLLPAFIVLATIMFGVKVGNLWIGLESVVASSAVRAETKEEGYPQATEAEETDGHEATDGEDEFGDDEFGADEFGDDDDFASLPTFSKGEIDILQDLSARRSELEARQRGLDMREKIIEVTENRVDAKLAEIKQIKLDIDEQIKKFETGQDKRLDAVVKVYSAMKPKDAARIFDTLGLEILIPVASRMKPTKVAPIMSKMNSQNAKLLTERLATREVLRVSEN